MNYTLFLPVYKQGDDFAHCLEMNNKHPVKSFLDLAEQYKSAAEICQIVAETLSRSNNLDKIGVDGCTHSIFISADENDVHSLIKDSILIENESYDDA